MKTRILSGRYKNLYIKVPASGTRPTMAKVRGAMFSSLQSYADIDNLRVLDLYAGSGSLGFEALSRGAKSCVFVDSAKEPNALLKQNFRYLSGNTSGKRASQKNNAIPFDASDESDEGISNKPTVKIERKTVIAYLKSLKQELSESGGTSNSVTRNRDAESGGVKSSDEENDSAKDTKSGDTDKGNQKAPFDLVFIDPPYRIENDEINEIFGLLSEILEESTYIIMERERNTKDFVVPDNMCILRDKLYGGTRVFTLEVRSADSVL